MITSKKSPIKFIIVLSLFVVIAVFVIRFSTPEDGWVCQNGNWVKHGNPAAAKPATLCPGNTAYVYFSNDQKSTESNGCNFVYPVERTKIMASPYNVLTELFAGPTADEKKQGYSSFFSDKTKNILKSVTIQNNIAYINLTDIRKIIPNASTSCGSQQFLQQIKLTVMRADANIADVRFAIDGNPQTFYDWIQIGCDKKLNNCDQKPFN